MANQQLQALSEARGTTELHHEPALFGVSAAGWVALAMLAVFAIMLWAKVPAMLAKMLDARIDAIRRQLDEAKAMRAEAEQLLGAAEARLKASAGDAEAIVAQAEQEAQALTNLRHLPVALHGVLALEPQIIAWSEDFARRENALFLGRGLHYPIALEGALKLKEISYIHAEAYPAGELKHGPLALVTEAMPVVTVAPNDALLEKLKSNIQEVRARGGRLYVFADADTHIQSSDGIQVIRLPEHYGALSPILHVVPLQLLAYHTACARGTDVDKPRNLAKSVTVE